MKKVNLILILMFTLCCFCKKQKVIPKKKAGIQEISWIHLMRDDTLVVEFQYPLCGHYANSHERLTIYNNKGNYEIRLQRDTILDCSIEVNKRIALREQGKIDDDYFYNLLPDIVFDSIVQISVNELMEVTKYLDTLEHISKKYGIEYGDYNNLNQAYISNGNNYLIAYFAHIEVLKRNQQWNYLKQKYFNQN